ncbi:hypothetical protein M405DRAFT_829657 [Rhizopogon salebrosus TDB-379]|nr:hypothetical protein M405DRAFT_829657 [Rhizopogon salebrosus TDB-379]
MNWFDGDVRWSGDSGLLIKVELKLTFKLVLYGYQPEVEVGLGQQKDLQVSFSSVSA